MLKKLILALCFILAASSAHATGDRLRLIYIRQANPAFPATQQVSFGTKTLVGAGGSPMGYASPQLLTTPAFSGTRWLRIESQVDHTGAASFVWTLDDRQMLVPTNKVSNAPAPITSSNYDTLWTTTHGGFSLTCGTVTGAPGHNCAAAILKDLGR